MAACVTGGPRPIRREPRPAGDADYVALLRRRIAALEEQISQLRQEKARAADETKAGISAALRRGDAELPRLSREADGKRAAIDCAKRPPRRGDTRPPRQRAVPVGEPAEEGEHRVQNERLPQDRERNSARLQELRRLARRRSMATNDAVRNLEADAKRAAAEFDEQIATLEEQIVLLRLETARIGADTGAAQCHAGAEASRLETKTTHIEEALFAAERPPGASNTELRRALARWTAAASPEHPFGSVLLLLSVIPGVSAHFADPIVRYAFRFEAGLIEQLPAWVPRPLRRAGARLILEAVLAARDAAPIWRLASDSRMRSVWRELQRHSGEGHYFFPAQIQFPGMANAALDQTCAMVNLFAGAVWFYQHPQLNRTAAELAELRDSLRVLRQVPPPHRIEWSNGCVFECLIADRDARHAALVAIADATEREIEAQTGLMITRHRTKDARLRSFEIRLSALTQALFGQPLGGSAATIASVLFDQIVPRSRVLSGAAQAALTPKDLAAKRETADRFTVGMLPVLDEVLKSGPMSLRAIADDLNRRGLPAARGGKWHPSSVRNLLALARRQALELRAAPAGRSRRMPVQT
jgi:hypothetical protein